MDTIPYIDREECVITKDCDLEILNSESYPIFCGCLPHDDLESDIIATQTFAISKSGVIQLKRLIPLDMLYQYGHDAGSVGGLWDSHHKEFAEFIMQAQPKKVLEIGGGHSKLALHCLQYEEKVEWSIVEPNPTTKDNRIVYIESFFTKEILEQGDYDTIIHSHTFEHMYDPHSFLADIAAASIDATCIDTTMGGGGGKMLFSVPNMQKWLENKWTNTLNFEHTILLTEAVIDFLLTTHKFKIHKKHYFGDHSIFYWTQYDKTLTDKPILPNEYQQNKSLFLNMYDFYHAQIAKLNARLESTNKKVYLFGAHLFSQYLLYHGLHSLKIEAILDNNPNKQNKRLYGTKLHVYSPQILANTDNAIVILNAGAYNNEIKESLNTMNNKIEIIMLD